MNEPIKEIVFQIMLFLFTWGPFVVGPPIFIFYKIIKGIKVRNASTEIDPKERKLLNALSYTFMGFVLVSVALFVSTLFMEKVPFIILLVILTFIVPIFMVCISFIAGLGKAFEAGFNATTLLNTLSSVTKNSKKHNKNFKRTGETETHPE